MAPFGPRSGPRNPALAPQPRAPLVKQREAWHSWTELTVRLMNLPPNIITWELSRAFASEGNIVFIEIFENRQGNRDGTGRVRFSPPPRRDFWSAGHFTLARPENGASLTIRVEREDQKRLFRIQSPVNKDVWYRETMFLQPLAVRFGVMRDEKTMLSMYEARPGQHDRSRVHTRFKVDLLRNRVTIYFQATIRDNRSVGSPITTVSAPQRQLDRINDYMMTIPLPQLRKLYKVDYDGRHWGLVISLDHPPAFFRKKLDSKASHVSNALVWSEFDAWYRQTDIVYDPTRLENAVVALQKDAPVIDLGRWTTYSLLFEKSDVSQEIFRDIRNALSDHNLDIIDQEGFANLSGPSAMEIDKIWLCIDPPRSDEIESHGLEVNESATPVERLPFEVRYQLEACMSHGIINEFNVTKDFVTRLGDLARKDEAKAKHALEYILDRERRLLDPMSLFEDKDALGYHPKLKLPNYCAYTRKATITPTTIYYSSPTVETTNRVLRQYIKLYGDRFLRVQFTDEKQMGAIQSCSDKARNDALYNRVLFTLKNGIRLGNRHYQFLAFGNSQFRQNGAYFFCPTEHITCDAIRNWMGDFTDIKIIAKYAARLGQCFSTTRAIHGIGTPKLIRIDDVERGGYCFTDGVGKISPFLSTMIMTELGLPPFHEPSAFQFRLGGCKGVLVIWPEAKKTEVHIRKSQAKFKAVYEGLEIIRCSQYSTATLNRQTIQILSALGVPDEEFNRMLQEQLSNYQGAMDDRSKALDLLSRYVDDNQITTVMASMVLNGFMETKEPFVMSLLHLWRAWSIKLLKEKARIIVESAAFVLGVTDETKTLRGYWKTKTWPRRSPNLDALPEIFLQISDRNKKGVYKVVEGICVLGRNPSLHPGDLRVVRAVDNLALRHLKDVVVFPQTGERDIPSMCSGGDLDGDDYFVIWDTALIPKEWNPEPMNYTAAKPVEINRPVTINDVMEFFVRYMKNDSLGAIAHAHLANSDFLDNGVKNPRCLELAVLHSKAVDYIKSGEPADLPKHLRPRKWPHFMEKHHKPKEQIYHSEKVLGQLYDRVESIRFVAQYGEPFDQRILTCRNPSKELKEIARRQKVQYDTAMRRIMAQQGIETEFEIWSTFALSKPRVGSDYKMQEELGTIAGALKDRFRKDCKTLANATSPGDVEVLAVAMYLVTWEEMEVALRECKMTKLVDGKEVPVRKLEPRYMPLISFPWLFYEVIGRLASGTARRDEVQELEKLGFQMASAPKSVRVHSHEATGDESPDIEQLETEEGVVIKEGQQLDLGDLRRHSPSQDSSLPPDQNVVERGVEEPANPLNVPHSPGPAAPRLEGGLFPADLNSTTVEGLPAVVTPLHMDAGGPRQLVGLGLQGVNSADGLLDSEVASEPHTNAQMLTVDSKQEKTGGNARIDVEEVIIQHAEESALEKLLKLTELSDDE